MVFPVGVNCSPQLHPTKKSAISMHGSFSGITTHFQRQSRKVFYSTITSQSIVLLGFRDETHASFHSIPK
jgi:hypothetical protein